MVDPLRVANDLRTIVLEAKVAIHHGAQKAIAAGQAMNEARVLLAQPRGDNGQFDATNGDGFFDWLKANVPEISERTAQYWMEAARNILRALPMFPGDAADGIPYIDIEGVPVSEILTRPDTDLSDTAREWRQTWMDFTQHKTIKDCINGLTQDDDDKSARRLKNAINGQNARQTSGDARKDYPLFIARKLKPMSTFLAVAKWHALTELQRTEIKALFTAAILGDEYRLPARPNLPAHSLAFASWPKDLCLAIKEAATQRLTQTA